MGAIQSYFLKAENGNVAKADVRTGAAKDAFEAMMEGAALMLDFIGVPIEYTYVTESGNKVHAQLDSPE